MKEIYSNINIIGGGLIGLATAYSLSELGHTISIIEKNPVFNAKKKYHDQRTVAISEGTKNFLDELGLWNQISKFSEPIKKIKIIDGNLSNYLDFDNKRRLSALGYIVKNYDLINVLTNRLKKKDNVRIFNNIEIKNLNIEKEKIIIVSKNLRLISDLNIAADGKNGFVKSKLKIPFFFKDYNKSALVTILNHTKEHNGTAFEFFYKTGPLAVLPMQSYKGKNYSSIVWTNNKKYLHDLTQISLDKLSITLEKETKMCLGQINEIISLQLFPITAHINTKFYDKRTIFIGDSAHSYHPIAGQGWNLGMSDLEKLFKLTKKYSSLGIDLGNTIFCKEYHDQNFFKAYRLYQITDKLDKVFQIQNFPFTFVRNIGLNYIQKNKKIKNIISDFAMGIN